MVFTWILKGKLSDHRHSMNRAYTENHYEILVCDNFYYIHLLWRNTGILQHVSGGQRTACESWFCPSTILVLRIKLRFSCSMASTLILWVVLAALMLSTRIKIFSEIWNIHGWNEKSHTEIEIHWIYVQLVSKLSFHPTLGIIPLNNLYAA